MGEVIRTAPERIYLITGDECPRDANFADLSEVTWCEDDVGGGIEYVRADLAEAKLRAELERRAPDGWKLVPIEPTEEMVSACAAPFLPGLMLPVFVAAYKTMLSAAPSAPKADDPVKVQLIKALEAVLNSGRGTSGRIILDDQDEADVRAAIAAARQEGGKV